MNNCGFVNFCHFKNIFYTPYITKIVYILDETKYIRNMYFMYTLLRNGVQYEHRQIANVYLQQTLRLQTRYLLFMKNKHGLQ